MKQRASRNDGDAGLPGPGPLGQDRVVRSDLRGELGEFLALLDLDKTLGVLEPASGEYPYKTAPMS